jgi:hypothetical protein
VNSGTESGVSGRDGGRRARGEGDVAGGLRAGTGAGGGGVGTRTAAGTWAYESLGFGLV